MWARPHSSALGDFIVNYVVFISSPVGLAGRGDCVLAVLVVDGPDARGRPTLMGTLAAPGARRSENKSSLHLYRHTGLLDRVCFFASVLQPLAFAEWRRPRQRRLCVSPQLTKPNKSSPGSCAALSQVCGHQGAERLRFERAPNKLLLNVRRAR